MIFDQRRVVASYLEASLPRLPAAVGVIVRAIADTIIAGLFYGLYATELLMGLVSIIGIAEEKEFVVVVVGSNDPIDPVTGGVGIVYLVVCMVAYNMIEIVTSLLPCSGSQKEGVIVVSMVKGAERRSYH